MLSNLKQSNLLFIRNLKFPIFLFIASIFFPGCKCGSEEFIPIPTNEIVSFCEELESSILRFDPQPFNDAFDIKIFRERVVKGLVLPGMVRKSMDQFIYQYQIGDVILKTVQKGEFIFEVTRIYQNENKSQRAVFRLFNGDYLNYIEFEFGKIQDRIVITKAYFYNTGQYLSQTLNDWAHIVFGKKGDFKNENTKMIVIKKAMEYFAQAEENLLNNNPKEAVNSIRRIDPQIIDQPFFFPLHLTALYQTDTDEYVKLLQKMNALNPDEDRFNLLNKIQISMVEGDIENTKKYIHFLSKYVGNDYVLDYYEANTLFHIQDYKKAIFYYDKFIKQVPNLSYGYFGKIESYIEMNDYEKAAINVGRLVENFEVTFLEVEDVLNAYPEFLKSEELELVKKGLGTM